MDTEPQDQERIAREIMNFRERLMELVNDDVTGIQFGRRIRISLTRTVVNLPYPVDRDLMGRTE